MSYEYPVDAEMARLTIILGIVIVTLVYKQTGMTLGGVIVPGYLALFVTEPFHVLSTLGIAVLAFLIVHNWIKKRYMLNGRRLFEIEILVALVLQINWNALMLLGSQYSPETVVLYGIGFVIPGLITHEMGRQGIRRTLYSTLFGSLVIFLIIMPLAALEEKLPRALIAVTTSPILRTQPNLYAYPLGLLPIAIVVSIIIDLLAYYHLKMRPGGFVTAAYIALFYPRPWDLLFVIVAALLTYLFVNILTDRYTLVFGRTKLGMLILVGVVIAWLLEIIVIRVTDGLFTPWSGFVVIMPMLTSLLANGFDRQGLKSTVAALGLSSGVVWLIMQALVWGLSLLDWYKYFVL